jgi:hypothetical protein
MAYGNDVTEVLPYVLSNPTAVSNFLSGQESYDVAIGPLPFFLNATDETPYRRQTAQYRKQQIDQSNEPGEQSITGWWVRAQSSFHSGDGINFYDPSAGETVSYRFSDSKGVDVWTKGKVTLLKSCTQNHIVTGTVTNTNRTQQFSRSIIWNGIDGVLLTDEYDVDKVYPALNYSITNKALTSNVATLTTSTTHKYIIGTIVTIAGVDATFNGEYTITAVTSTTFSYAKTASNVASTAVSPVGTASSTVTHFIDYNSGADAPVYAICDDGTNAYWITNTATKKTVYKKALTGGSGTAETKMFDEVGAISNATMEFVKERIVMCADNKVYEFPTSASAMPTAVYTHPSNGFTYTSITASGPAIYIAGFNGIQSNIQKFTLSTAGVMPTLTSAVVAAELPVGEQVHKIFYYLGYMMIGTSKGIRAAEVSDVDGSIKYGPLIVETTQPCYDFAARDRFIWCATGVDGEPGLIRIDLNNEIEKLSFAYANDIYYPGVSNKVTTSCAFTGSTNQLTFTTPYSDSSNGNVYLEHPSNLIETGYLTTGAIRYGTLENKIFKTVKGIVDNTYGSLAIKTIDYTNNEYNVGSFSQGDFTSEVGLSYPIGSQEFLKFKFVLGRYSSDSTLGPTFSGFQLKSLPAVARQRIITYPLACYDREKDTMGNQVGYEGVAYYKLTTLEQLENLGDTVRIQDFRNDEIYEGIIEEVQFINRTPTDKRFSGFGGILLVTIRTL